MTIPIRRTFDAIDPRWQIQITDDGSPTLIDREHGNSMHSGCGAVAETQLVYLQNSGVATRLQRGQATRVLEVGLGSGLGCLLTCDLAARCGTKIEYVALEKKVPTPDLITQLAFERQGIEPQLVAAFGRMLGRITTQTKSTFALSETCSLVLYLGDALAWSGSDESSFDAVYFDPYCPDTNAELWTADFLTIMHNKLVSGGRLVSYCVNRRVRDTLTQVGFAVDRVPGPVGGKREVLIAHRYD